MRAKTKENLIMTSVGTVLLIGVGAIIYGLGWSIFHVTEIDIMVALAFFGSVCVICGTVIYLIQAENSGKNRIANAEAAKKVERIQRSDRIIDHK